jgi:hypothetical protein
LSKPLTNIKLSFFTTSQEEYLQLWEKASSSEYVNKFRGELWSWESGDKLYLAKIQLLVNTKLPQLVVERFLRIKLRVESYTNNLRTNSGGSTKEILSEEINRYKPIVVEIRPPKSLLSVDIAKLKRLSLREVKLPTPERRVELITPPLKVLERPPTDEEIAYSKLVSINPLIEELVDRFNLVSNTTGERIKKVELKEDSKPQQKAKNLDAKKQNNMSKQKNNIIQITPELEGKFLISVELKHFEKVSFYKKFTGYYFNQTNKKLSISFVGSKGYFNHLEFIAETEQA